MHVHQELPDDDPYYADNRQIKRTLPHMPPDEDELSSVLSPMRRNLSALGGLGRLGGTYFTQADIALAILRSRAGR